MYKPGARFLLHGMLFAATLNCGKSTAQNPDTLDLQQCYTLAVQHYPEAAQKGIISSIDDAYIHKINAYWQPQVTLNAQATYQSDVVGIPVENPFFNIPELSKDQYKASLDLTQTIYDGGNAHQQKVLSDLHGAITAGQVDVDLYQLRGRINQIYFSILLAEENIRLINTALADLQSREDQLRAGIQYGAAMQNDLNILQAEILKTSEKKIEAEASRISAYRMLSELTGTDADTSTHLVMPAFTLDTVQSVNTRPEIKLFDLQKEYDFQQEEFSSALTLPRLSFFIQGGYGKPGLNYLLNEFDFYYLGGIKLTYPLWTGNSRKYDADIYSLNSQTTDVQKQVFELNSNIQARQALDDINKLGLLLQNDTMILALKTSIAHTAAVQLDNGVITSRDYVSDVNDALQASIDLAVHKIEMLSSELNYLTILGKIP